MTPIMAADLLSDRVPFYEAQGLSVLRVLADRGAEYCGKPDQHDYRLSIGINDIECTRTKVRHPQTNGICECFQNTVL